MPTIEVKPLKVESLLKEVSSNIKEIKDALLLYPSEQAVLLEELAGWSELMVELLKIISIHRELNLPDDAPDLLPLSVPPAALQAKESNLPPHILEDKDVIDPQAQTSLLELNLTTTSTPTTHNNPELTLDSKQGNAKEKTGYGILGFFKRVFWSPASSAKESVNSVKR